LDCLTLEYGTESLSRNVGNLTTTRRCVTSQKSKDLIYTVAKAWRHEHGRCCIVTQYTDFNKAFFAFSAIPLHSTRSKLLLQIRKFCELLCNDCHETHKYPNSIMVSRILHKSENKRRIYGKQSIYVPK